MQFKTKALLASLVLASASNAFAETANLVIKGTITPAACAPTINNSGQLELGRISQGRLKPTQTQVLETKSIGYTIACSAPTKIAMKFTDSRATSTAHLNTFGLGFQGAETKIGSYDIQNDSTKLLGDGTPVSLLTKKGDGAWIATGGYLTMPNVEQSWATTGETTPTAFTNISGALNITPVIEPTNTLDLTEEITIDGLATMEIVYL